MVSQYTTALDSLPLWGLFFTVIVLVLAAIEGNFGVVVQDDAMELHPPP